LSTSKTSSCYHLSYYRLHVIRILLSISDQVWYLNVGEFLYSKAQIFGYYDVSYVGVSFNQGIERTLTTQ
jgi:hypothetical protein